MPKLRKYLKTEVYNLNIQRKFRIGTRKSGQAATRMTNTALIAILANTRLKKHHSKVITVLKQREVDFSAIL